MTRHGATYLGNGTTLFRVWAPGRATVEIVLDGDRRAPLVAHPDGFHGAVVGDTRPGTRYRYLLDGEGPFADPASRSQPDGVHGPSEVMDLTALGRLARGGARGRDTARPGDAVSDRPVPWRGVPLAAQVICEIHVGTFSRSGDLPGVVDALDHLADAGYTVLELMPLGEFPGARNWGYDGVFPFAVQSSYGGPAGLAELTRAAHDRGLAVVVDVVDNHLGPEGAVHDAFGPYLTDRYRTPWGRAVNFDGPGSDAVRAYFVEQACYFVRDLGVDGLRLDAVHEIHDATASRFLAELTTAVGALARSAGRTVTITAESPANDPLLTTDVARGGLGCDSTWDDDFHHSLRTTLTGSRDRWFADFDGIEDLATAFSRGWVLSGRTSAGFGRRHGAALPSSFAGERLTVFAQNHDQIGNAGFGARLATSLPLAAQFAVAATVLLAPFVPLRFMGEEYGETAPFHYFTSHSDAGLVDAVRSGRAVEVGSHLDGPPPDPQHPETFAACRPERAVAGSGIHAELLEWQRVLLAIRRTYCAFGTLEPGRTTAIGDAATSTLTVVRGADTYLDAPDTALVCRLGASEAAVRPDLLAGRSWRILAARGCTLPGGGEKLDCTTSPEAEIALAGYGVAVLVAEPGQPVA